MIPTVCLGRTGLQVTRLGYGSMGLRGPRTWGVRVVSDADAEAFLHQVLDSGINFIDTAPDYGISEQRIGDFLSSRRDEFYLATKCGCDYVQHADHLEIRHRWTKDVLQRNLATSLERLKTDHIDLLQFHGGDAETIQRAGLLDAMLEFREQGMVRFLGASSSLPELDALLELDVFDAFQIPYSLLAPEHDERIARAAANGAGVIVRGGIAHGGPEAAIQRPALNTIWERAELDAVLPAGMAPAELILRYTLSHPGCHTIIVGTCDPAHLAENRAAVESGPLPLDLHRELSRRVAAAIERPQD